MCSVTNYLLTIMRQMRNLVPGKDDTLRLSIFSGCKILGISSTTYSLILYVCQVVQLSSRLLKTSDIFVYRLYTGN